MAWEDVVDSWREDDPRLSEKVRLLARQAVFGGPEQLGDTPDFRVLVAAIDHLRMRETEQDTRSFLAGVILERRYKEVHQSLSNSLHDQLAKAVFDFLSDIDDVNWTGQAFGVKKQDVMAMVDWEPVRVRWPSTEKAGRLRELLAMDLGYTTSELVFHGVDDLQPLQDNVAVLSRREETWQDHVNEWPACNGRQTVVDLVSLLCSRPLDESGGTTWGDTAEFDAIVGALSGLIGTMAGPRRGADGANGGKELQGLYEELAEFLRERACRLPGASPQSLLSDLKRDFAVSAACK